MPQYEEQLIALLNEQTHSPSAQATLLQEITAVVNELIAHDFSKLVEILYRVDVNETTLKENIAKSAGGDAAPIIAQMLLERQQQKLALRQSFRSSQDAIPDEEKW